MTENSERCCTCTTPEITIKLNKQGPQGLTGPQGEPGFSPVIEVSEETPTSYRLSIQTLEGSYETPNLKANFPLGGYVNQVLVKQSNADGDATWDYIPYATTETTGGLTLATEDDVVVGSDKAITGDILAKVVAGYVDLTSTQSISGAKTFNNNLTVGDSYTLSTHYLNARSGEIQVGGTTALHKVEQDSTIPGYNSFIQIGGNLPLLISAQNDVVRIKRNGSAHIIVDKDNIRDYMPIDTSVRTTFLDGVCTSTVRSNYHDTPYIEYNGTYQRTYAGRAGMYANLELRCGSSGVIETKRGDDTYTNLDSGNISSDPYIQSLVARIEALES